ncbi:hypothetical protein [Bradyrhizobium sp. AZCC 2230]|uniref:hypothetical protein n=1 Tax=Bradyrhizobium sp. AZCC 2230 TaxID=3117021 RepID=UPI002FF04FB1
MFAREQKLLAHLGKASTAEFLVEQFEYGGHCHPHRWNSRTENVGSLLDGFEMRAGLPVVPMLSAIG